MLHIDLSIFPVQSQMSNASITLEQNAQNQERRYLQQTRLSHLGQCITNQTDHQGTAPQTIRAESGLKSLELSGAP